MNLNLLKRAIDRNLKIRTRASYEKFLQSLSQDSDVWIVSQGKYILWWHKRASSDLRITVYDGKCHVTTNLPGAVIENYPHEFYVSSDLDIPYPDTDFRGSVLLTIDQNLNQKEFFKEVLRREGILNFTEGSNGEFFFSEEVSQTLEELATALRHCNMEYFHECVLRVRCFITERLAQRGLPLLRIWYHPFVDNRVIKTVVSVRYDVDRALTNMPKIWDLEHRYRVSSTAHLRPFCPFYTQKKIRKIAKHPLCQEIALHSEFSRHSSKFVGMLEAAIAEKTKLEELIGREVLGVSLHGGELMAKYAPEALDVIQQASFLYNASLGPAHYYFPYRLQRQNGGFEGTYRMHANFGDIRILCSNSYTEDFYNEAIRQFKITSQHNGVLLMILHPIYFGVLPYLLNFENLIKFFTFMPAYLNRLARSPRDT